MLSCHQTKVAGIGQRICGLHYYRTLIVRSNTSHFCGDVFVLAAIGVIPLDRLLAESDLRSHIYGGTAAALWYLAQCRGIAITEMATITTRNAQRMLEAHRRAAVGKPS